jgi:hypothetical protein
MQEMRMQDPVKFVAEYQRNLFQRLDEFFVRATGKTASNFSTIDAFGDVVRSSARKMASRGEVAFRWLDEELRVFYAREGADAFSSAQQLGGMKLVLGGSSRFLGSQLTSVSTSVLYSDTVLIPDPVMPWLEKDRTEEKFRHVLLLQAVHALLHLKPLVDADLQYPAVLVFPSWEKTLEDRDEHTQKAISQLIADVFSNSLGETFESLGDVKDYADRNPERFLVAADSTHLFVAPGGPVDERLVDALARYQKEMETWRSQEWLRLYTALPAHLRVLNGVTERLGPLYHLLENAEEMGGHPLLCLEQHAHYYKLISDTNSGRLERLGLLDPHTRALVDALGSRRLRWLGGLPSDTLARLREDNEQVGFRKRLRDALGRLHDSMLSNVDNVAAEICHELASAITDHEKQLRGVQSKYNRIHGQTAALALAAAGAALIPALAPFLGTAAPFALAAKYGRDKIEELAEKRALTQSLVGVLAIAASKNL